MQPYPKELLTLIAHLKKLPGVGRKSAERFAFTLLNWSKEELYLFGTHLQQLKEKIFPCQICGCLQEGLSCPFCLSSKRDTTLLCLVSSPKDVYAIEETHAFKGLYHVLGGLLSPLEGRSVEHLALDKLERRLQDHPIEEVIIAFDSTLEGDATALYIKQKLERLSIKATRLSVGVPMGSSIDFVDYGTLEKAFTGRQDF